MTSQPEVREQPTTADLVQAVVDDAHRLLLLELALAKDELGRTARAMLVAAAAALVAAVLTVIAVTMLIVAFFLALGATLALSLFVGGLALVSLAGAGAVIGYRRAPKDLLSDTRARLNRDFRELTRQPA